MSELAATDSAPSRPREGVRAPRTGAALIACDPGNPARRVIAAEGDGAGLPGPDRGP